MTRKARIKEVVASATVLYLSVSSASAAVHFSRAPLDENFSQHGSAPGHPALGGKMWREAFQKSSRSSDGWPDFVERMTIQEFRDLLAFLESLK
jgi:hypothetical protein